MAQGKFQSDKASAPHPVAAEIAKRREHDASGTHRWAEFDGQRQCQVKACAAIETWSDRKQQWL